jgi:hypothetical protein
LLVVRNDAKSRFKNKRKKYTMTSLGSSVAIIGMTLLKGDWEKDYFGHPEIFR